MDRFRAMSAFVAVVEAGGFTPAARRLAMPLATLSRTVSQLEDRLRLRLLNRSTRRVGLTDQGQQYFEACRRILGELGEAERAASGEYQTPRGELIVTAPIVFGRLHVIPIVTEFIKVYAQIDVRLVQADRIVNLLEEHVDLAVRIGELPDSNLVATRIGSVGRVACASPTYLAERGRPEHPKELTAHDCVTFTGLASPKEWPFQIGKSARMFPVRSRIVVTTAEAAIGAAIAGAGIARVLSYQVAQSVREGRLVLLMRGFEPEPLPANLLYPSGRLIALKLRAFLDFAAPRLKARLQSL